MKVRLVLTAVTFFLSLLSSYLIDVVISEREVLWVDNLEIALYFAAMVFIIDLIVYKKDE